MGRKYKLGPPISAKLGGREMKFYSIGAFIKYLPNNISLEDQKMGLSANNFW